MRAAATKCHVLIRVASDVKFVRIIEHCAVAITGPEPDHNFVTGLDVLTAEYGVTARRAPEVVDRTGVAQELFNGPRD